MRPVARHPDRARRSCPASGSVSGRAVLAVMGVGLALSFSSAAMAQAPLHIVLGQPIPETNLMVCSSAEDARRQASGPLMEHRENACSVSRVVVTPRQIEASIPAFRAPVATYAPGSERRIENLHDGRLNQVPVAQIEQIVRAFWGTAQFRSGEEYYVWAFIPEQPYHSAFLAAQASRRQSRP